MQKLNTEVNSTIICNSHEVKTTQISINWQMDKMHCIYTMECYSEP